MKKIILFFIVLFTLVNVNAQSYERKGYVFSQTKTERSKSEPTKTKFTWKDNKGKEYPIYISSTGSCYVIRTSSKTGKEYKSYLNPEISKEICKELGVEYKSKKKNEK